VRADDGASVGRMRIAVLGPLEVSSDDGVPVAVPGAKERLLLAVLAAGAPGVVSTDRIVEALWNGRRPVSARKSLQVHLVHLRSALEPDRPHGSTGRFVVRRGTGYALTAEDVDALRVADLVARGRARLAVGDADEAARSLSAALDLWRGDPYGDWPEASFAEAERHRLAEVRNAAVTALLEARLALGAHAEVAAEAEGLVVEDPLQEEWWRLLVLALYRCGRQGDALAAVARARGVLAEQLGADPGPRLRAAEAAVLAQDPALDLAMPTPSLRPPPGVSVCPYKGLASYQASDVALFHGRSRLVSRLVARLVDAPLLVVSGASGAGKSSVIRAGLVPALAQGAVPGSEAWQSLVVTPGRAPVDALAGLTGDPPPTAPVVLVCDQLEELWSSGIDPVERRTFLDALLGLLDDGIVVRCLVVVRGDHLGRLAEHPAFADRLGSAIVLVPALTEAELREVVREPASAVGLTAEDELLDAVVADVGGRPGALPLLSTALVGTWERRREERLTLAGYLEAGGVAGALTRSAEAAYAALDDDGRATARRLLVRLADIDDSGALVRRPVLLADLDLDGQRGSARRAVVDEFVGRRLLSVDGNRLEVAHEALFTAWPRLARWLEDDAAGRTVRRHLAPAARAWANGGRPDEELYRGARLAAAQDWAAGPDADVTPAEEQFLAASRARSDAELEEARERARREAAARRRTRRLAIGLAAVLVLALVAAGAALRSQHAVEVEAVRAEGNRLASQSRTTQELDLAMLLAAQGFRLADTAATRDALRAAVTGHRRALRVVPLSQVTRSGSLGAGGETFFIIDRAADLLGWPVMSESSPQLIGRLPVIWAQHRMVDASPTEERLAAAGPSRVGPWVRVVDARRGERLLLSGDQIGGDPVALRFTADGRLLDLLVAAPTAGGAAIEWRLVQVDPETGTSRETATSGTLPAGGRVSAHISQDAEIAVLWTDQRADAPTLVDLTTGGQVSLRLADREAEVLGYRAIATGAAQLWDDGAVILYNREGRSGQTLDAHRLNQDQGPVRDVVLQGDWAATVGDGAAVYRWTVDPETGRWTLPQYLAGHGGHVREAHLDPDGGRLITVAPGDRIIVWDLSVEGGSAADDPSDADTRGWLQAACATAGRDLTRAEWDRYLPGREWQPTCTDLE
jgi:DNA-binding SARP family transcriptional activator